MPNETLKTLTMPIKSGGTTTPTTFDIPQGDVKQTELDSLLTDYAKKEGTYEDLVAGSANQLIPSAMETERVPYNFRTSGGSLDIGDREFDKLVGLSLPWNQLSNPTNVSEITSKGLTFSVTNGILNITGTSTGALYSQIGGIIHCIENHKYFVNGYCLGLHKDNTHSVSNGLNDAGILNAPSTDDYLYQFFVGQAGRTYNNAKIPLQVFDLTLLLGSTIADYVYGLEQATAGAGVAWFKKFFPKQYYAYNSGEIESVKVSSHDMVRFNQWDEEWEQGSFYVNSGTMFDTTTSFRSKNYIPIIPSMDYRLEFPYNLGSTAVSLAYYDADKNFIKGVNKWSANLTSAEIPQNARFMKFASQNGNVYHNDICIHLKWDGSRNTEYEPYVKHSYALDPIELRGILKLDSNNEPYADGDTYEADGTVTRRYGIVDLGSFDWSRTTSYTNPVFYTTLNGGKASMVVCSKYVGTNPKGVSDASENPDKSICVRNPDAQQIFVRDDSFTDATAFKTAMSGVYLVYELATPTTEEADPYTDPQTVDNWGTEQYIDKAYADGDRDVEIPVGHETKYPVNLRDKLETAPNAPTSDGDYIVHCESGQLTYIALGSTTTIQNIISRLDELEG